MRVLVTGAAGFLGRSVVARCAEAGHHVVAMIRPATPGSADGWPSGTTLLSGDLRQAGPWQQQLEGVDAVIHLAAATSGDFAEQFSGTVVTTETLLASLPNSIRRFIHISSFSVYDYGAIPSYSQLDENSPLERRPERRDAYTWTKLIQEKMVVEYCGRYDAISLVVLRPGAIFGPGHDWDFGRALKVGGVDLIFAPFAPMKLTFVDNCAEAIARALDRPEAEGTINIVDCDAPTHAQFHRLCRRAGAPVGRAIFIPWVIVAAVGLTIRAINEWFLSGRAKLPELLDFPRQQARWKPLRYSRLRAATILNWSSPYPLADGVSRTFKASTIPPKQGTQSGAAKLGQDGKSAGGAPIQPVPSDVH